MTNMETDLPYLSRDPDRHGNPRIYVRRKGKRIRIKEPEGTPAFAKAYSAAVEKLEDQRLITGTSDTVRLAHEQLITAWPRLARAVAERSWAEIPVVVPSR